MADVRNDGATINFDFSIPLVIIGGGACGLVAGLAALSKGIDAVILERDGTPRGSTFMSSGFIPAAGTRFQKTAGVEDSSSQMAEDILRKNYNEADPAIVTALAEASGEVIEWLADKHHIPFEIVDGFLYPGHSCMRMHCTPRRTGEELMSCLLNAAEQAELPILTEAHVTTLHIDDDSRVRGVSFQRRDGSIEQVGCDALLLACNGYGGNPELMASHIPQMASGLYYGHPGNQGEAVIWGEALGASLKDLGAYQGHGSLAWPHQTLISWAVMMQGGIQLNQRGVRFSNEHNGYSEQAAKVLAQPDQIAFNVYDARIHEQCQQFEDYRNAHAAGAIKIFESAEALADGLGLPNKAVLDTFRDMKKLQENGEADSLGRKFPPEQTLVAPYYVIRVTGALFHTQGGLEISTTGKVIDKHGQPLPNLFAAGGAARGVSGAGDSGYLSGNGLLSAVVMGVLAGRDAAKLISEGSF
ncbi:FAD-dependent oxidoreductase [Marinobacter sp. M3C]|jgi:fumarate reductase flavoprotein subunit|uniref:FAD-dependent oxidoreductase n=1 Tax=unclassified Marinobacter TaxID=83889 RepID=UPI00200EB165|nr:MULTISPECIES: FAD-dependent oxidoreductase [unclassified Marinobacter]MCL1479824.1 FAD-dependent oxidoreductase [Marinobacter sp.]MCL1486435.1 FAD-dependent oxidoreductase [Marinobacter sp.]UQG55997.1 FAD-dependent oxidoreductase [Marinobacter sp. M4C]UQG58624.1 FAD-dependent oxidoreductase [Marinobacter sp. M3C]UQG64802.1 FAD-dependent oxidoreductase [Marinobacter sp. M2C]